MRNMNNIGIIASVIAAVATIIMLFFSIRNSKGNLTKRIERKERKINKIENSYWRKYGHMAEVSHHYPTYRKIERLNNGIAKLRKRI